MKTPWLHENTKPVHIGVYEKDFDDGRGHGRPQYQYWDGKRWWYGDDNPEDAYYAYLYPVGGLPPLPRPWRGLTSPQLTA